MTMLEKAARAIGEHYDGYVDPNDTPGSYARALDAARAVLAAIRGPDEAMLSAAYGDAIVGHGAAYTAMIDAILEGETK